jgi:hypothetical protein
MRKSRGALAQSTTMHACTSKKRQKFVKVFLVQDGEADEEVNDHERKGR